MQVKAPRWCWIGIIYTLRASSLRRYALDTHLVFNPDYNYSLHKYTVDYDMAGCLHDISSRNGPLARPLVSYFESTAKGAPLVYVTTSLVHVLQGDLLVRRWAQWYIGLRCGTDGETEALQQPPEGRRS